MMNANGPIANPDLRALLNAHRDEIFSTLNCHQIGIIQSYDRVKQTCTVQIASKRVVYNQPQSGDSNLQQTPQLVDYPLLVDVPVLFPSGGGGYMYFPLGQGDRCLVLFNDRDIDNWFATGDTGAPNSPRMHSLADGIAIVGIRNATNPVPFGGHHAGYVGFGVEGKAWIEIDSSGNIQVHTADGQALLAYQGGEVAMQNSLGLYIGGSTAKANIHNGGVSLKDALDALMTALTGWVNTGGSTPNPATVTALNAAKTAIDALLQ